MKFTLNVNDLGVHRFTENEVVEAFALYKDLATKLHLRAESAALLQKIAEDARNDNTAMLNTYADTAQNFADKLDVFEQKVRKLEANLRDAEHEAASSVKLIRELEGNIRDAEAEATASFKRATQLESELEIIKAKLSTIVDDTGAGTGEKKKHKKACSSNFMGSIERSLDKLQFIVSSSNQSPVTAKDHEALEEECNALKAANVKLLDDVACGQKDRQSDKEEIERLREQLRKLRAEKEGNRAGKKKKGK